MYSMAIVSLLWLIFIKSQANCEQQPDVITTTINDYYGFMKNFNGFVCEASGTNLKFYWRHRDQLVDEDYPLKFLKLNSSTLQPNKDFLIDAYDGTYQCFASNSIGTVFGRKATVKFTIVGDFHDDASLKTIKEVVAGQPSWIHCPRHDTSYNVRYKWVFKQAFEHVPLPPSPRYFVSENGTLYFASIELKDVQYINSLSGIHCKQQAYIEGEHLAKYSHQILLWLRGTAVKKSKPAIKTVIGTQSVFFGEKRVVFKCGAIGNPIPDLKWYKLAGNGGERTEIKDGKGYRLERFNRYLSIRDVTTNKAGDYLCVANNTEGKDEASGRIIVANVDRPQWTVGGSLSDVNPPIESKFVWECEALGGATYTWYKDGNKMSRRSSQQGKYVVKDVDAKSQLIFTKVTEDNNGMYQCTAGNEQDTIYSTGRLKVQILGLPSQVRHLTVENISKSSVILKWDEPSDNEGFNETLKYDVECYSCSSSKSTGCVEKYEHAQYHPAQYNLTTTSVSISGLRPASKYKFKVYSKNMVSKPDGVSWKFEELSADTLEEESAKSKNNNMVIIIPLVVTYIHTFIILISIR